MGFKRVCLSVTLHFVVLQHAWGEQRYHEYEEIDFDISRELKKSKDNIFSRNSRTATARIGRKYKSKGVKGAKGHKGAKSFFPSSSPSMSSAPSLSSAPSILPSLSAAPSVIPSNSPSFTGAKSSKYAKSPKAKSAKSPKAPKY